MLLAHALLGGAGPLIGSLQYRGQLSGKLRQRRRDGVPNDSEIDVEIAMHHAIAHAFHASPRSSRKLVKKTFMVMQQLGCGLANDHQVHDHGLLRSLISEELGYVHVSHVDLYLLRSFEHVLQVIDTAVAGYSVIASASTCALYLAGDYFALPNTRYANDDDHLHRHPSKQRYVVLPSELLDHNLDSDKVY